MPNEFYSVVTNIGKAKIAQALANDETLGLKSIAVGDGNGNPVTPTAEMLVREVYRGDLSSLSVDPANPNYMVAEVIIPTSEGGWTVREVGLFDSDGNLIAVANYAESYKPIVSEGSGRDMLIRLIIQVEDGETEALELNIDPSIILASRQWVELNFTIAAQIPGGNTGQILRKASNADGDTEWYDPLSGLNVLVETVEESQSLAAAQDVIVLATATTASTAYYIDGVRLHPDEYTIDSDTQITLAAAAAGGEKFLAVQNEPAAGLDFLQKAQNLADIPNKPVARQNLGVPTTAETLAAMLDLLYPVGEIVVTMRSGSPDTWGGAWTGFGTWEQTAKGRTLVGLDSTDADFNVLGKQGGAKKHLLTIDEMPRHNHTTTAGRANSGGSDVPVQDGESSAPAEIEYTGGDVPHNNLQPYLVVNIWKRTA